MKICIVTEQLKKTISGVGLYTNLLVRALLDEGHDVWVLAPADQCPEGPLPYHLERVPGPGRVRSQARWFFLSWHFGRALRRLIRRERFDLIHFTDARQSFFSPAGAPRVGMLHDTYAAELQSLSYYRRHYHDGNLRWAYYRFVHLCEALAFPRLEALIANSRYTAAAITRQYKVRPEKISVCYIGIDDQVYEPALDLRAQLGEHAPKVLFVGGNMHRKGLPLLIRAASTILASHPATEFWVVGEDPAAPRMQALAANLGVADRFKFLGWKSQPELIRIYAQADLFVMPSLTEAFGLVFLEAMAAGAVPVATAVGGVTEIIQSGVNGLTIPAPGQPEALAVAVIGLLADRQARERLRENGIYTARAFRSDVMMGCTRAVFEAVIARKRRR